MPQTLLTTSLVVAAYMTIWFLIALLRRDNSLVDIAWGLGFVLIAWSSFFRGGGAEPRQFLVNGLVTLWGLRLAAHIASRKRGKGEDFRYAAWRRQWGRWLIPRSFLQIFLLQGLLMLLVAWPIILINHSPGAAPTWLAVVGALIWGLGFFFEALGDLQLQRFKRDPRSRGRIMTGGLWSWTRHPNYFGEVTLWWGIFLIVLDAGSGWTAVISPLTITFLLLRVSGIPMLEKKYHGNPGFEAYAARTPAFFPRPPVRSSEPDDGSAG